MTGRAFGAAARVCSHEAAGRERPREWGITAPGHGDQGWGNQTPGLPAFWLCCRKKVGPFWRIQIGGDKGALYGDKNLGMEGFCRCFS